MSGERSPLDVPVADLLDKVSRDLRSGALSVAAWSTTDEGRLKLALELVGGVNVETIDDAPAAGIRMCPKCGSTHLTDADPKKGVLLCLKCNHNFDPQEAHTPASE